MATLFLIIYGFFCALCDLFRKLAQWVSSLGQREKNPLSALSARESEKNEQQPFCDEELIEFDLLLDDEEDEYANN